MSNVNPELEEQEPGKIRVVYPLVINLNKPAKTYRILVKRGDDKSRVIKFTLVKNGEKYALDGNDIASMRAIREDGTFTFADCEVKEDGTCEYTFTENMTTTAGLVTAELSITTGVGETITTFEFYIIVEKILYNENDYVSENDLSGFKEYLAKARAAAEAAEEAQGITETAREEALTAQEAAENAQEAAETAQGLAENAQGLAENAQSAAESAQSKAEEAKSDAIEAASVAESERNAAVSAKSEAVKAQELAENAQDAAESEANRAETAKSETGNYLNSTSNLYSMTGDLLSSTEGYASEVYSTYNSTKSLASEVDVLQKNVDSTVADYGEAVTELAGYQSGAEKAQSLAVDAQSLAESEANRAETAKSETGNYLNSTSNLHSMTSSEYTEVGNIHASMITELSQAGSEREAAQSAKSEAYVAASEAGERAGEAEEWASEAQQWAESVAPVNYGTGLSKAKETNTVNVNIDDETVKINDDNKLKVVKVGEANTEVLEKFSTDEAGKLLFDGEKIAGEVATTHESSNVLTNSANGNIVSAEFKGWARKSKNLLNVSFEKQTISGITYECANGVIYVNGTRSGSSYIKVGISTVLPLGRYFIIVESNTNALSIGNLSLYDDSNTFLEKYASDVELGRRAFDVTKENGHIVLNIKGRTDGTLYDGYVKIMLLKQGDVAGATYEPFGIITPSGKVESRSKNLFEGLENGAVDGEGNPSPNSARARNKGGKIAVTENQTYTLSAYTTKNCEVVISYYGKEGRLSTTSWKPIPCSAEAPIGTKSATLLFRTVDGSSNPEQYILDVMFSNDAEATAYVPYAQSEITLPYTPLGIGDVKDELIVYADGSGKWVQNVSDEVITSETPNKGVAVASDGDTYVIFMVNTFKSDNKLYIISDKLKDLAFSDRSTEKDKWRCYQNNGELSIKAPQGMNFSTVADFMGAIGGSVRVVHRLPKAITTNLSAEQVRQILSLKTFADVTYIDADGLEYNIGYYANTPIGQSLADIKSTMLSQMQGMAEMTLALDATN